MQDKQSIIRSFVEERPKSEAIYGYGSGVFKQIENSNPQIDLIFIVDDLKEWHQENIEYNRKDYSYIGKIHLSLDSIKSIKGHNNITYFSNIQKGENRFKYGVIEVEDFTKSLTTWNNTFISGRFHKPVLAIKEEKNISHAIDINRKYALAITSLLSPSLTNRLEFLQTLCSLSYIGDTRMLLAENPYKVSNIVLSNYSDLSYIYLNENMYLTITENDILINHYHILKNIEMYLPSSLIDFLAENNTNLNEISEVRNNILKYIIQHNRVESYHQTLEGFSTNGIIRSIPYILAKIDKRLNGQRIKY